MIMFTKFLLKFYRIQDWIKVLGLVLIPCILFNASPADIFKLLFISSLLLAYGFSVNDFFDFKCRGEENLVGRTYKKEKYITILLLLVPPLTSLYLSIVIFSTPFSHIFFVLDFLLFSFYSIPPFRLRDKKICDIICNSTMFPLIFVYSYFYFSSSLSSLFFFFFIIFTLYFTISEIIHQLSHFSKDETSGRISTAIWLGKRTSLKIINLIALANILFSLVFILFLPLFSIISLFFSILRVYRINSWKSTFSQLRNKIYGMEEGLIYVLFLLLLY